MDVLDDLDKRWPIQTRQLVIVAYLALMPVLQPTRCARHEQRCLDDKDEGVCDGMTASQLS